MGNKRLLETLIKVETRDKWFEVYKLPNEVFAIMEPYHFQEVISYLIVGSKRALLFDTGAGLANIRALTEKLCDKEIIVANSHTHFDHVGNNHLFHEALVYNDPKALERLRKGYRREELAPHASRDLILPGHEEDVDFDDYSIPPSKPKAVEDGQIIDLGDRRIKVTHTPGHSPDSVMLLDIENKMLFTGDSYYPGHLYAHFEGDFYGNSDVNAYAASIEKVRAFVDELASIHPSHNDPVGDPRILKKLAVALRKLANGEVEAGTLLFGDLSVASLPNSGEQIEGYVIPDDLYIYDFDEFKIIARKRHRS